MVLLQQGQQNLQLQLKVQLNMVFEDKEITIPADATFTSGTEIREIDLYDFGLYITGVPGEKGLMIKVETWIQFLP